MVNGLANENKRVQLSSTNASSNDESWYFKKLGQELGPLNFEDLVEAARKHTVEPADLVRLGETGDWQRADAVPGIFAAPSVPFANSTQQWMVQVFGDTLGPLSMTEL